MISSVDFYGTESDIGIVIYDTNIRSQAPSNLEYYAMKHPVNSTDHLEGL
jgi:hypothetical protein